MRITWCSIRNDFRPFYFGMFARIEYNKPEYLRVER